MRTLPRSTRIVLINLWQRHRRARALAARNRALLGADHVATATAEAQAIEAWNALQGTRECLWRDKERQEAPRPTSSPAEAA